MTKRKIETKKTRKNVVPKKIQLELTLEELTFVVDLFGLMTPVRQEDGQQVPVCVTTLFANSASSNHIKSEKTLWEKVADVATEHGVPIGDEAPTFYLSAHEVPSMYVYDAEV